jgi:hypothetical protein
MTLYEKILAERAEEERRKGRPLDTLHASDSPTLERRLDDAAKDCSRHSADLVMLRRYTHKGPTNVASGIRYMSLKKKHPEAYCELKAEARGQEELL